MSTRSTRSPLSVASAALGLVVWIGDGGGLGSTACAAESPLELHWVAPSECPSQAEVASDVARRLGDSRSDRSVVARAMVTRRRDATWTVVLSTKQQGAEGQRVVEAPTCAEVASATALILALTIDPRAALATVVPAPVPPPPPPPPVPEMPPEATLPIEPPRVLPPAVVLPRSSTRWQLVGRAGPTVGLGVTASAASGGGVLAVGAALGRYSLEVSGVSYGPQSLNVTGGTAGGRFWPLAVGGSACAALTDRTALRSGVCLGGEAQRLEASGYGVRLPGSGSSVWAAPSLSSFLALHTYGPLWAGVRADLTVPLQRPTFGLENVGEIYRVNAVSARLGATLEVRY